MAATADSLAPERWWAAETVAVVTGANKGIGFEIAQILATQGLTTIVTCRNESLGAAAVAQIQASAGPASRVEFAQLDITDDASIQRFGAWMEKTHRSVTILINNAGIASFNMQLTVEDAETAINTNFLGALKVCERLKPLMAPLNARIINVSSGGGTTTQIKDEALLSRFTSATMTAQLLELAKEYIQAVRDGVAESAGWTQPGAVYPVYRMSKMLCTLHAKVLSLERPSVMVNAACPGFCATDLSRQPGLAPRAGAKTPAQGADTPLWLALRPASAFVTGQLFSERAAVPFTFKAI